MTLVADLILIHAGAAAEAHVTQIVVTNCTEAALRAAIGQGGPITISCGTSPITITLAAELEVAEDTIIDGGNLVTISGGHATRVFHTANYVALTLQNLTASDGRPLSGNGSDAAIYGGWRGKVTILHSRFENNDGTSGNMETGGATASSYTTLVLESTTRFWVQVSNSAGSMDSNTATVEVRHNIYLPMLHAILSSVFSFDTVGERVYAHRREDTDCWQAWIRHALPIARRQENEMPRNILIYNSPHFNNDRVQLI